MATDDERREVARRLREMGEELGSSVLLWYHIAKILGVRTATDGKTACDMLADLIEPSDHIGDSDKMVDREALLEEVKELEKCAWYFGLDFDADEPLRDRLKEASEDFAGYARRIREACGAVDAG